VALPRRPLDHRALGGPTAQPRQRHGAPELRDVELVHQPGDRPDRAVRQGRRLWQGGARAAEAPRREGRSPAPRCPRRGADRAHGGAGGVHRRAGPGSLQGRPLPVLVRRAVLAASVLALLGLPGNAAAVSLQPVGTFNSPIYMTSAPGDPRLFVVERAGTIQVVHDGVRTQFLDIHTMVDQTFERGLQSMAFDPNYASNGLFYVYYTGDGTNAGGALGDIHVDEYHVSSDP